MGKNEFADENSTEEGESSPSRVLDANDYINKLTTDLSSNEYHSFTGTYSSSQFKDILDDPEIFYKKYISKEIEKEHVDAFDVGTYFHTAILEPHLLDKECVVYEGGVRNGKKWEDFKALHAGKAILNPKGREQAEILIKAVKESPIAMSLLEGAEPEITAFAKLYVMGDDVFSFDPKGDCQYLTISGWVPGTGEYEEDDIKDFAETVIVKVRADIFGRGKGRISDLKSTTGSCKTEHSLQGKISGYKYDLSAALYLDIFSLVSMELYDRFYWIFASKDMKHSKTWDASAKNIMIGRSKWKKAVCLIAKYKAQGWKFTDEMGVLEPAHYENAWLENF